MRAHQTLYDDNGYQVALFPLEELYISQGDTGTYSHDFSRYYATDCVGYQNGSRVYRCPCYAPVDIELIWKDSTECCAMWKSVNKVHLSDGSLSYIGIIIYHDNDIQNNTYYSIGTIKTQGEEFCKTGTGGNVTGDHIHIEIGKGIPNLSQYKYHFLSSTSCKRIRIFNALFINDTTIIQNWTGYNWKTYQGGSPQPTPTPKKYRFKWVLYANKLRNK